MDPRGVLGRMHYVNRYSGYPALVKENVAEHSWQTSVYCLMIAKDFQLHDIPVDLGLLLQRAIVHDLDESMSGDVIRSFKYAIPELKEAMTRAAEIVFVPEIQKLVRENSYLERNKSDILVKYITDLWRSCSAITDIEGLILKVADFLTVLCYSMREYAMGNKLIVTIIKEVLGYIVKVIIDAETKYADCPKVYALLSSYMRQIYEKLRQDKLEIFIPNEIF
jgi:5'-deoxynucleotidase YfbR-like HD superfamily hydrolase